MLQDGTGRISFKEFVIGLWNVCSFDEFGLLRFAFQMFDSDSSGYIEIDEIEELVKSVQGNNYEKGIMRFVRSILRDCDKNGLLCCVLCTVCCVHCAGMIDSGGWIG